MLGTPGSGKSFFAKREMANAFFATDDHILILDAENEYTALTEQLQGQNIYLAPDSHSYLNPMDLDLSTDVGESPMLASSVGSLVLITSRMRSLTMILSASIP